MIYGFAVPLVAGGLFNVSSAIEPQLMPSAAFACADAETDLVPFIAVVTSIRGWFRDLASRQAWFTGDLSRKAQPG